MKCAFWITTEIPSVITKSNSIENCEKPGMLSFSTVLSIIKYEYYFECWKTMSEEA